jgi:hypothetical protein
MAGRRRSSSSSMLLSKQQPSTVLVHNTQMEWLLPLLQPQQQQRSCNHPATTGHLLVLRLQAAVA